MTISKQDNGKYLVDIRPAGRTGKRVRRSFPTKGEALAFERWTLANQNNKDWLDKPADRRQLSELIDLWWKNHGQTLTDGPKTYLKLKATCNRLNCPRVDQLTQGMFASYRTERLASGKAPKTLNCELRSLKGVFNKLTQLGLYHAALPLHGMTELKLMQTELGFLTKSQICDVLGRLTGDDLMVTRLCLSTGARWNEAAKLPRRRLHTDRVEYAKTKTGKNRIVPINQALAAEILEGRETSSLLFPKADYTNVRTIIKEVAPDLPRGQATHVYRHTFASHFMMNGGNILVLQRILGHAKIQQTMVYAHFAPDHLAEAVTLNPLVDLNEIAG
ncbi:integrase [Enterobacter sp. MF024]|uniref:phage integrase n=1 Tax=Enterobacter sp. MF024 TaxID=2555644 RepID=UPI001105CB88|nr:tyrosine-type recombinase/integrase [Enterobacter sp. MF024]TLU69568.1 integrase [Enterobacter sp. MF024]